MKNTYFLSGAYLGSRAIEHGRTQERRLVDLPDSIRREASAVCLLGDMFDFWYEFRLMAPKGYTCFLGKLSELTDMGTEVYPFTGNHDIWCEDYLSKECGVIIHRGTLTIEIYGRESYLVHNGELGGPDKKFKSLRWVFHSTTLQTLFSVIHPRQSVGLGLTQARHSREKRVDDKEPDYMGGNREHLIPYTKEYLKSHPSINFFTYGYHHIELDLMLSATSRILILGDWINYFSYVVFGGGNLFLEEYIEGETQV